MDCERIPRRARKIRQRPQLRCVSATFCLPRNAPTPSPANRTGKAQEPRPKIVVIVPWRMAPPHPVSLAIRQTTVKTARPSRPTPIMSVMRCEGSSLLLRRTATAVRVLTFILDLFVSPPVRGSHYGLYEVLGFGSRARLFDRPARGIKSPTETGAE